MNSTQNDWMVVAEELGQFLAKSPVMQTYREISATLSPDSPALQLRARLEAMYDDLIQRQTAGEIIPGGEIDAYYELESQVRAQPELARRDSALEKVKDLYTEVNQIITNQIGMNLLDLLK